MDLHFSFLNFGTCFPTFFLCSYEPAAFRRSQHGQQQFQGCCGSDDRRESELEPLPVEGLGMLRSGLLTLPAAAPNQVGARSQINLLFGPLAREKVKNASVHSFKTKPYRLLSGFFLFKKGRSCRNTSF